MKTWTIEQLQKNNPIKSYFDKIGREYTFLNKFDSVKFDSFKQTDVVSCSLYTIRKMMRLGIKTWYDEKKYSCSHYYSYFGRYLLNDDYVILPVHDVLRRKDWIYDKLGVDGCVFFRPDKCDKPYSGGILKAEEFLFDVDYAIKRGQTTATDLCVISSPKGIEREWRCVLVSGKVVACSRYYSRGALDMVQEYPEEVIAKAQHLAGVWSPTDCFVLDICKSGDEYCLVQMNSFNSSGMYSCNIQKIVTAIDNMKVE